MCFYIKVKDGSSGYKMYHNVTFYTPIYPLFEQNIPKIST